MCTWILSDGENSGPPDIKLFIIDFVFVLMKITKFEYNITILQHSGETPLNPEPELPQTKFKILGH